MHFFGFDLEDALELAEELIPLSAACWNLFDPFFDLELFHSYYKFTRDEGDI